MNSANNRKVGIMGGTFNPIHIGHLRSAEEVREAFGLETVIFVPSATPPHKDNRGIIAQGERYLMVASAVSDNPRLDVSDVEILRGKTSYTIDTLEALEREMEGTELYFILGLDAFLEIGTWREYEKLFEMANFVVTDRPDGKSSNPDFVLPPELAGLFKKEGDDILVHLSGKKIYFYDIMGLEISSTEIRGLIKKKKSIKYLVPERVKQYIELRGLYR